MYAQVEKPKENKSRAIAQKKSGVKQGVCFVDNRSSPPIQRVSMYNGDIVKKKAEGEQEVCYRIIRAGSNNFVKLHRVQDDDNAKPDVLIVGVNELKRDFQTTDDKGITEYKPFKLDVTRTQEGKAVGAVTHQLPGGGMKPELKKKAMERLSHLKHSAPGAVSKDYSLELTHRIRGGKDHIQSWKNDEASYEGLKKMAEKNEDIKKHMDQQGMKSRSFREWIEHTQTKDPDFGKKVQYLEPSERDDYKVKVEAGKCKKDSENFSTDTMETVAHGKGWAMFVLSKDGSLYSGTQIVNKFHHSSFMAGGAVMSAGEWKVVNGTVIKVTDKSGHYKPNSDMFLSMLNHLRSAGVNLKHVIAVTKEHDPNDKGSKEDAASEFQKNKGVSGTDDAKRTMRLKDAQNQTTIRQISVEFTKSVSVFLTPISWIEICSGDQTIATTQRERKGDKGDKFDLEFADKDFNGDKVSVKVFKEERTSTKPVLITEHTFTIDKGKDEQQSQVTQNDIKIEEHK